jgi:HEPN domain-containing protein
MQPREVESLVRAWVEKANADLEVALRIAPEAKDSIRFREIVGFHCQQATEKYLNALLTRYQIEFPRTHDIKTLPHLVATEHKALAAALDAATWLTPFGVEVRYPSDAAELLAGEERKAIEIASTVKQCVLEIVGGSAL